MNRTSLAKASNPVCVATLFVALLLLPALPGLAQGPARVKIVTEFPMFEWLPETQGLVNAVQMAIDDRSGVVCGNVPVQLQSNDHGSEEEFIDWDKLEANAGASVADPEVAAVVGTYNSGVAAVLIPLLNEAGLVTVSPTNTGAALTRAVRVPGEITQEELYPNGIRHYARVISSDRIQGRAAALWARRLGVRSVVLLDNPTSYGVYMANRFAAAAANLGLNVVQRMTLVRHEDGSWEVPPRLLAPRIAALRPDLVFVAGFAWESAPLLRQLRRAGYRGRFMVPDGSFEDFFIEEAGAQAAEGVLATVPGAFTPALRGAGAEWRARYVERFGDEFLGASTANGYVTAQVLLAAMDRVCAAGGSPLDRAAVRAEVFRTRDFESVIGTFSIDAYGDTTSRRVSGFEVRNGRFEYTTQIGQ